jgi:hypothetical protein
VLDGPYYPVAALNAGHAWLKYPLVSQIRKNAQRFCAWRDESPGNRNVWCHASQGGYRGSGPLFESHFYFVNEFVRDCIQKTPRPLGLIFKRLLASSVHSQVLDFLFHSIFAWGIFNTLPKRIFKRFTHENPKKNPAAG